MAPAVPTYAPRDSGDTVLYKVIAEHLETFLASCHDDPEATGFPAYVEREFYDYLRCGILAHGFLRLGCDTCHHELLVPFRCKRRGFCPSWAGRRMAPRAAHLVEQVIPWVPTRQWVVSVPRIGKSNGIFTSVSTGAHPRSPRRLDATAPRCPTACACKAARWLWWATSAMTDAAPSACPAFFGLPHPR